MEFTNALIRANQPKEHNIRDFDISNEGLDRHRSIILAEGWTTKNFKANPVIQYVHSANRVPNPDLVIGQGIKVWMEDKTMASRALFDVDGEAELSNALAKKVLYKVDSGFLRATSVGFDPLEHGPGIKSAGEDPEKWYHRKQDLLEWSVVPVPSNPGALMRNLEEWLEFIDKEGLKGDDLNHYIEKGLDNAPKLIHLDGLKEQDVRQDQHIHFHFDFPSIEKLIPSIPIKGELSGTEVKLSKVEAVKDIDPIELRYRVLALK